MYYAAQHIYIYKDEHPPPLVFHDGERHYTSIHPAHPTLWLFNIIFFISIYTLYGLYVHTVLPIRQHFHQHQWAITALGIIRSLIFNFCKFVTLLQYYLLATFESLGILLFLFVPQTSAEIFCLSGCCFCAGCSACRNNLPTELASVSAKNNRINGGREFTHAGCVNGIGHI